MIYLLDDIRLDASATEAVAEAYEHDYAGVTSVGLRDSWFDEHWPDTLAGDCTTLDVVAWSSKYAACTQSAVKGPVKHTLVLRVRPTASPELVGRFEQELCGMPDYIGAIRNWCFARVERGYGEASGTHLWQQEFDDLSVLLISPDHWGLVDRWFDREMPECVVSGDFAQVFCRYPDSVSCER